MPMLPILSIARCPAGGACWLSPGLKVPSWCNVQLPLPVLRSSNQRTPESTTVPVRAVFWLVAKVPTMTS
jgi:hypothetical protein